MIIIGTIYHAICNMNQKEIINEEKLGIAHGLYSQGIRCGDFIFTTQIGNEKDGSMAGETMYEQACKTLENAEILLATEGSSLRDVVKCTIYITDMMEYAELNKAYKEKMPGRPFPARACVEVSQLSPESKVEMEFVAYLANPEE